MHIDTLHPLLPEVLIAFCSFPAKELESHPSVRDVLVEHSPGDVRLECKCNPVLDFPDTPPVPPPVVCTSRASYHR